MGSPDGCEVPLGSRSRAATGLVGRGPGGPRPDRACQLAGGRGAVAHAFVPQLRGGAGRNGPPPRPRASRARRGQLGLRLGRRCRRSPRGKGPPAREPPQPDGADAGPGRAVSARRTGRAQRPARYLRRDTRRPCAVRARPHPVRFAVGRTSRSGPSPCTRPARLTTSEACAVR